MDEETEAQESLHFDWGLTAESDGGRIQTQQVLPPGPKLFLQHHIAGAGLEPGAPEPINSRWMPYDCSLFYTLQGCPTLSSLPDAVCAIQGISEY